MVYNLDQLRKEIGCIVHHVLKYLTRPEIDRIYIVEEDEESQTSNNAANDRAGKDGPNTAGSCSDASSSSFSLDKKVPLLTDGDAEAGHMPESNWASWQI